MNYFNFDKCKKTGECYLAMFNTQKVIDYCWKYSASFELNNKKVYIYDVVFENEKQARLYCEVYGYELVCGHTTEYETMMNLYK